MDKINYLVPGCSMGFLTYIYSAVCLMTIANKLGAGNAWWAWIPILNLILLNQVAEKSWLMLIMVIIPVVNLFYFILVTNSIAEKLGKPSWVGWLLLIPPVWPFMPAYLAFL